MSRAAGCRRPPRRRFHGLGPIDALRSVLPKSTVRDDRGRLTIAGCALADVIQATGTPALIVDEGELEASAREYLDAFAQRPGTRVYFASKALSCSGVIAVFARAGLGCDVSSAGELAVALEPAGWIPRNGSSSRQREARHRSGGGADAGVGLIVVDSLASSIGWRLANRPQSLLLRANPGVSAPTHEAMATGRRRLQVRPRRSRQLREAVARIGRSRLAYASRVCTLTSARRSPSWSRSSAASRNRR